MALQTVTVAAAYIPDLITAANTQLATMTTAYIRAISIIATETPRVSSNEFVLVIVYELGATAHAAYQMNMVAGTNFVNATAALATAQAAQPTYWYGPTVATNFLESRRTQRFIMAYLYNTVLVDGITYFVPGGTGGYPVAGSGTVGTIPMWVTPVTLGNSSISQDSSESVALYNLLPGADPTTPVNGDTWLNAASPRWRLSGATYNGALLERAQSFTAMQTFAVPTTSAASIVLPHGTAPTTPSNGMTWTTTSGLFVQINGATQAMVSGSIAANQVAYGSVANTIQGTANFTFSGTTLSVGSTSTVNNTISILSDGTQSGDRSQLSLASTGGTAVWAINVNGVQSGSNAGATLQIKAKDDAGATIDTPFQITRAAGGQIRIERPIAISGVAASSRILEFSTNGVARWRQGANSVAEGGSNSGSNYTLNAYDDAGALIDIVSTITRASSGNYAINRPLVLSLQPNPLTITQQAATAGSPTAFTLTGGAHTTLATAEAVDVNLGLARTVQFGATGGTIAQQRAVVISQPTYSAGAATTITTAATVAIMGAPSAGTNVTITNSHSLVISSGTTLFNTNSNIFQGSANNTTGLVHAANSALAGGANHPMLKVVSAADTNQTASAEINSVNFQMTATRQWATGAIATQREFLIQAPVYSFVAASTITNAATVAITGAPIAGALATLTNSYALWVQAGLTRLDGGMLSSSSTQGIGYTTGAGGTVTQATSRATGVTLSKPTGQITLFTAAGSATPATFTVTNTTVAATDGVTIHDVSGSTNVYFWKATAAAGSFTVTFWTTGGTASDTPVVQFIVHKGAAA
jgi:hypothetical protein